VQSDGTKINSEHIDITDDFGDGFVNALRVETADKTYFGAESAERLGGVLTTFHNGVYTACEPCEDSPTSADLGASRHAKIVWNGEKKTVRFENSNFEFFGFPLAYLPAFEIADPTVKRKSGFLMPGVAYKSHLGAGFGIPYYLVLSPTYDLTARGTYFTKQGFLGEAEWRQRFDNGQYSLKIAGMRQQNPGAFDLNTVDRGTPGDPTRFRGMMGTKGQFAINERWDFGWNVLVQTDKNFANTYDIQGYRDYVHRSEVYLTGLNDRNYFDLRAMRFQVQENTLEGNVGARNESQPWVLPSFDYAYIPEMPLAGGQLSINLNARGIVRDEIDEAFMIPNLPSSGVQRVRGIEGQSGRLTGEAEWKRTIVTDGGLLITPLLAFQADGDYFNASSASLQAIDDMATAHGLNADTRSSFARFMATAGLELRWPVLFTGMAPRNRRSTAQLLCAQTSLCGGLAVPTRTRRASSSTPHVFERDSSRLRSHRGRHARQSRLRYRQLRQWLDDQRAVRPVL